MNFLKVLIKNYIWKNEAKLIYTQILKRGLCLKIFKKRFNIINLCKISNIIDLSKYPFLSSVIDTRGIDSSLASAENNKRMMRENTINYIDNDQDKCIFIFIDGIKPAPPPSIINILQSRITEENVNKFYLLVNIYDNEAENAMTDDGKVLDPQTGIDYKTQKFKYFRTNKE